MKCSCLDIGSNTIKISIFEKRQKHWRTAFYQGEQTGLISYVEKTENSRVLSSEGIEALCSALERLISFSKEKGVDTIFAFATASLRGIDNTDEVLACVMERIGLSVEILSEEEEALCSLKGLLCDERCEGVEEGVMIDMGGGSCEIVHFKNGYTPEIVSLKIGCLDLTNKFISDFPPKISETKKIKEYVKTELEKCPFFKNLNCSVYLIGGTARAVGKLSCSLKPRNKEQFSITDFDMIVRGMCEEDSVRQKAKEIIPKRLYNVTAGAAAYSEILKFITPAAVFVSESGVREGYLERILL